MNFATYFYKIYNRDALCLSIKHLIFLGGKAMSARLEYKEKEIRVYLDGEIDHHSASLIRAGIDEEIIRRSPRLLVLDFREVSFMDSSAVGMVMGRYRLMSSIGGKISVEGLTPSAYKVMRLAGLEKLGEIKIREDLE